MKICLDAGHGTGQNQSPARCGYFEGDRMFTLQRLLQQELVSVRKAENGQWYAITTDPQPKMSESEQMQEMQL